MHTYTHSTRTYMCAHTHKYRFTHMHKHASMHAHAHTHKHTQSKTCIYTHEYTHIYMHVHAHTIEKYKLTVAIFIVMPTQLNGILEYHTGTISAGKYCIADITNGI